jgi:SAM-dependent methyltransferase
MEPIHSIAARGFEQAADVYERARPSYPNEAIEFIRTLSSTCDTIVDLGAGTGKLTRLLDPIKAREIVAIEPVEAMRKYLESIPIVTRAIAGTAEQMPLTDNSVDMLLCAQSFHWFANDRALAEIHRVLKPNGLLVVLWNKTDDDFYPWWHEMFSYVDSFQPVDVPRYKSMQWQRVFSEQTRFTTLQFQRFTSMMKITKNILFDLALSMSFIGALPDDEHRKFVECIQQRLNDVEVMRNENVIDVPHRTDIYWCSAVKTVS